MDIQITGCEIDANGNFLREGSIVIQGIRLGYLLRRDRCLCSSLTIIDDRFLMLSDTERYRADRVSEHDLRYDYLSASVINTEDTESFIYIMRAAIDSEHQWCFIELDDVYENTKTTL